MQTWFASFFDDIGGWLAWAPDWAAGSILLALAAIVALGAHGLLLAILRRVTPKSRLFVRSLIERTRGPLLLSLLIFAVTAALQAAPFEPELAASLTHALLLGFLVLLGWAALAAIHLAADLYLRRFRIDVEDNLLARKHTTQVRILQRAMQTLVVILTIAGALMTFESVRQYGVSLFASAGVAGLIAGFAARPVLSNLIAGVQIAITQPIRIDDVIIVEGEWGWIEEITATYVVVRIWDLRRLIVPLSYFIEQPFQNWTRESASLLAPVVLYLDYTVPLPALRAKLDEIVKQTNLWDGKVKNLQVTDARENTVEVRAFLSARNSGDAWNLRCEVREKLIEFLQGEHPNALPHRRAEIKMKSSHTAAPSRARRGRASA